MDMVLGLNVVEDTWQDDFLLSNIVSLLHLILNSGQELFDRDLASQYLSDG